MKNLFLTFLLTCGIVSTISAQQNSLLELGEKSQNDLTHKDWSSFDHLISGQKKNNENSMDLKLNLKEQLADLAYNYRIKSGAPGGKPIDMPIFEPKGYYAMTIYPIDSTYQYHLRIFKLD
jgi:hypothetical protein